MSTYRLKIAGFALCAGLIACSASQITVALDVAAVAVDAASSVISGLPGINPATQADIVAGLSAADTALTTAAQDLQSSSITGEQIAAIAAQLAASVSQLSGIQNALPPAAKVAIQAVIAGVDAFLALWQAENPAKALVAGSTTPHKFKLAYKDRRNVSASLGQLEQARNTLAKIKK